MVIEWARVTVRSREGALLMEGRLSAVHKEPRVEWIAVDQGIGIAKVVDATSKLPLDIVGAVAKWEASIIAERTKQ